ncbi:MAG: hypothetical protein AAGC92_02525 [Pseudomonadota bacterium]
MDLDAIYAQLLRAIGTWVAILTPVALDVRFANTALGERFEGIQAGASLAAAMPDLDREAGRNAFDAAGHYAAKASSRKKYRTLVIAMTFTRTDAGIVLLECQTIACIRAPETTIERNTCDIQREKERVEKRLLKIMPGALRTRHCGPSVMRRSIRNFARYDENHPQCWQCRVGLAVPGRAGSAG